MTPFQMTLRLSPDLARRIRMIAASNNIPMNTFISNVLTVHADQWEHTYGKLPMPPQEEQECIE
jgi:predicted DNA binding CopG/RHH family protein